MLATIAMLMQQTVAAPTPDWAVTRMASNCMVKRSYGAGATRTTRTTRTTLAIITTPGTLLLEAELALGRSATPASDALIVRLAAAPSGRTAKSYGAFTPSADGGGVLSFDMEREAVNELGSTDHLTLTAGATISVTLPTTNSRSVAGDVERCERELLSSWGVDPARFRPLARRGHSGYYNVADQINQRWYPLAALAAPATGRAAALLRIEPSGRVSQCRVVSSTENATLDAATCGAAYRVQYPRMKEAGGRAVQYWTVLAMTWALPD